MAITYSSSSSSSFIVVFSCIIVFFIGLLWKFLNWAWFTPKKLEKKLKDQGLIGIPYTFSFGDFTVHTKKVDDNSKPMNLYDDDLVPRILHLNLDWFKGFDKKCFFNWLGPTPVVTIMDVKLVKEITLKNYQFLKVPHNPLTQLLMKGISSLDKEEWSKHRKIIAPAFHAEKVKLMVPAFYTSTSEVLKKWEENVSPQGSSEIDVWPYLQKLTSDIISRTAFGSNYEEGKEIFELQKEQAQYYMKVVNAPYVPGRRFFPNKMHRRMKEISRLVNDRIRSIVDARLKTMKERGACGNDFLGLLLESNTKEINECGNKDFGLTIQDVIEECKLLYFSGQETTSVLLVWTMFLLARHPEWQNRAREEVLQHIGSHQVPDHDALNHLKIVTMILCEVLRLYTPTSMMQRIAAEEIKLGDMVIPRGVILVLPTLLLHHDPELWGDDAKEFNPERFAEGISNATKGQLVSFLAFSWGPRICLGQNFAMAEAKMAISMILRHFSFEIGPSYLHFPHTKSSTTLQPKYGAHLILHKL